MVKGREFLAILDQGRYTEALAMLPDVHNINRRKADTGMTALHIAASQKAYLFTKTMCDQRGDIDYLAVDRLGRRATDIVWEAGGSDALYDMLLRLETQQELGLTGLVSGVGA